ncbi:PAS domain-containing methyl-accepting chemotaxis protein [Vogesella sp. XCS3]|uniref:methyl-accepting chemotaxis protein n=1 Tax=Vogesella sp. XCS3 TaxID=2877939 RepID=UPI001D0B17D2|nr:PAS domain-containing methyl-accepting chemotaxis protein [Vogesella sp. XCS3]UDM15636.1 methyl-accepting chemotaxis protein [Vogesella sp. XCS3]
MRTNLPVSQTEIPFTEGIIVTQTTLDGTITYANDRFVQLSGFSREELLGQPHNIVRHPEMPPVLFADLWHTVKQGQCWRGLVKNRTKCGDYYWVDAFVVPVLEGDNITGYMSVRTPASRADIQQAEQTYPALLAGKRWQKPPKTGRLMVWFRPLYVTLMTLMVVLAGATHPDQSGLLISALGMVATGLWLVLERQRKQQQQTLLQACRNIAQGKLTNPLCINRAGDQGKIENALAYMQVNLKVMLDNLQWTAHQQTRNTQQVQVAVGELLGHIDESTTAVTQMGAAVEELSASIEQVASNAEHTARLSQNTRHDLQQSVEQMASSQNRNQAAAQAVEEAQNTIRALSSAIGSISQVTQTIHDIADQTNLLALNAAIEAARAGESGRGFAVVADEVRKLAERTSLSTDEIKHLVSNVQLAAKGTVDAIAAITQETRAGVETVQQTLTRLDALQQGSGEVNMMMQEIAVTNAQQSATAGHLAERMTLISARFDASTEQIATARQAIAGLASEAAQVAALASAFEVEKR